MGILDRFKKKNTETQKNVEPSNSNIGSRYEDKLDSNIINVPQKTATSFIDIENAFPKLPHYDDSYKTDEGYKLRELLFLVWISRFKKGRDINKNIPQYFHYNYDIDDTKSLIDRFIFDNFVELDGSIITLTDSGKILAKKYENLWTINRQPDQLNLDKEFKGWNEESYKKNREVEQHIYDLESVREIENYIIIGANDDKVCPKCLALRDKVFSVSELKDGENFPPFHEGCRCTYGDYDETFMKHFGH